MKQSPARVVLGLLLTAAGVLSLLQSFGYLERAREPFRVLAFGVAGGAFLYMYLRDRAQWWPLIPGCTLLGLGALIAINWLLPQLGDVLGVPLFLGMTSLSFWVIYLHKREQWWAVIPGGVLLSVAAFVGLQEVFTGTDLVGVLFFGMGMTFALIAYLPGQRGRMQWSLIPAGIFFLMGIIFLATAVSSLRFLGPGVLVLIGLYLIVRTFDTREKS